MCPEQLIHIPSPTHVVCLLLNFHSRAGTSVFLMSVLWSCGLSCVVYSAIMDDVCRYVWESVPCPTHPLTLPDNMSRAVQCSPELHAVDVPSRTLPFRSGSACGLPPPPPLVGLGTERYLSSEPESELPLSWLTMPGGRNKGCLINIVR